MRSLRLLAAAPATAPWRWNLAADWRELTRYPFMRNALWATVAVGILCGLVGWFVVLRQESFLAHALAMVAFPGAAGAAYFGLPSLAGYLTFAIGGGATISALTPPTGRSGIRHGHSAATGTVLAAALALGFLFVSLYGGLLSGLTAFLFGSFLGISAGQTRLLFVIAAVAGALVLVGRRPLLWASVDPEAATGAGVRVDLVAHAFVILLAVTVAVTSPLTGALLVFALLVAPAATAQVLTARPALGMALSVGLAVLLGWTATATAYFTGRPVGWWVTTFGLAAYVLSRAVMAAVGRRHPEARPQVETHHHHGHAHA